MNNLISRKALCDYALNQKDKSVTPNDIMRFPSAQPEQRWIPTSKKLPEYDKPVLLSTAWCKTEIGFWTQRGWMIVACSYREFEQDAVTAWMPLPEPYRRGGENE